MSRPYMIWKNGSYVQLSFNFSAFRPNRNAAGVTATVARRHKLSLSPRMSVTESTLSIRGTFDELRGLQGGLYYMTRPKVCACCGQQTGKMELTPYAKRVLLEKRAKLAMPANMAARIAQEQKYYSMLAPFDKTRKSNAANIAADGAANGDA